MKLFNSEGYNTDVFYILLLYSGKYSFLPDLHEVVGREKMSDLLSIFAGTTIKFPSEDDLRKTAFQVQTYVRIKSSPTSQKTSVIRDIADENMITVDTVENTFIRASRIIEDDLGVKIEFGRNKGRRP